VDIFGECGHRDQPLSVDLITIFSFRSSKIRALTAVALGLVLRDGIMSAQVKSFSIVQSGLI
jgi:hypothetical protein